MNITEDNVVSVLETLNSVVNGTPEGQRNDSNARAIANTLSATAALLQSDERVQISSEEVCCY